jgi:hypothetical protein
MFLLAYFFAVGGTLVGLLLVSPNVPAPASRSQFITTDMLQIIEPDHAVKNKDSTRALNAFAYAPVSEKVLDGRAAREAQRAQDSLQVGRKGSRPNVNSGDRKHPQRRDHVQRRLARENTW